MMTQSHRAPDTTSSGFAKDFAGSRIGLLGFAPHIAEQIASSFATVQASSQTLIPKDVADRVTSLQSFDAVLVDLTTSSAEGVMYSTLVASGSAPIIVVATPITLWTHMDIIRSHAADFLVPPWNDVELLVRTLAAIRRPRP
jgi:DNA-binding response OmpR family regulator